MCIRDRHEYIDGVKNEEGMQWSSVKRLSMEKKELQTHYPLVEEEKEEQDEKKKIQGYYLFCFDFKVSNIVLYVVSICIDHKTILC